MTLEFNWAEPKDLPGIENFVREHFGEASTQMTPGRLAWLHACPGGVDHSILCTKDDEIIGMCCHLPRSLKVDGSVLTTAFGIDLMVAPAGRRQGVGQGFLRERCARFDVGLSTGQSQAMSRLYREKESTRRLARWHSGVFVRRLTRPTRLRAGFRQVLALALALTRSAVKGARREIELRQAVDLLPGFSPRHGPEELGVSVTAEWFLWRYGGPVYSDYRVFELTVAGSPQGLAVSRQKGDKEHLVDLYCRPENRARLLRLCGQTTPGSQLEVLVAGAPLVSALRAAGFLVRPEGAESLAVAGDPKILDSVQSRDWIFFAGDSDVDLIRKPNN